VISLRFLLAGSPPPEGPLHRQPGDHNSREIRDIEQELENRAPGLAPLPKASDTPASEAAGMVVTEMNTPIKVLDRSSVSETTPTTPARRRR
jgi:hypothetical protein